MTINEKICSAMARWNRNQRDVIVDCVRDDADDLLELVQDLQTCTRIEAFFKHGIGSLSVSDWNFAQGTIDSIGDL